MLHFGNFNSSLQLLGLTGRHLKEIILVWAVFGSNSEYCPYALQELCMKHLSQLTVILAISFFAELIHAVVPLPIPASIYGMVLMFLALSTGLLKLNQVKETGHFLVGIMAVMFIVPAVGLMDYWEVLRQNLFSICLIIVVSLVLSFAVTGIVTQWMIRWGEKKRV